MYKYHHRWYPPWLALRSPMVPKFRRWHRRSPAMRRLSSVLGKFWDVESPIADVKPEGVFMGTSVASASPTSKPSSQDYGNDAHWSGKGEPSLPAAVGKEKDDEDEHGKAAGALGAPVDCPGTAAIAGRGWVAAVATGNHRQTVLTLQKLHSK